MTTCPDCGQEVRIVEAGGETLVLDSVAQLGGTFRLSGEDGDKAELTDHKGQMGYMRHEQTCPEQVRRRERF